MYKWWLFYTPNKRLQTAMAIQVNTWGMKLSPFIGTSGNPSIEPPPVTFYMRLLQVEIIYKYQVQSGFIIKAIVSPGLTSHQSVKLPPGCQGSEAPLFFLHQLLWTQVLTMSLADVWISLWDNLLVQTSNQGHEFKAENCTNPFLYH